MSERSAMETFYKTCDMKYGRQMEQVECLSHSEATRVVIETTSIHDIISEDGDLISCDNSCLVLPVNTECIKLLLANHDTMVTWNDQSRKSSLRAFSYSTILPVKRGMRLDIYYFGKEYEMCLAHFAAHFRHTLDILRHYTTNDIPIMLHIPKDIDKERLEKELVSHLGQRFQLAEGEDPTVFFIFSHRMPVSSKL